MCDNRQEDQSLSSFVFYFAELLPRDTLATFNVIVFSIIALKQQKMIFMTSVEKKKKSKKKIIVIVVENNNKGTTLVDKENRWVKLSWQLIVIIFLWSWQIRFILNGQKYFKLDNQLVAPKKVLTKIFLFQLISIYTYKYSFNFTKVYQNSLKTTRGITNPVKNQIFLL